MDYTKIQNKDYSYNGNDDQSDKIIKLIDTQNNILENENKNETEITYCYSLKNGIILMIILTIIFLFLVFIYQNNITNNNNKGKDKIIEETEQLFKDCENITEETNSSTEEIVVPFPQDVYKIESFNPRAKSFNKAKVFLGNCINETLLREVPSAPFDNPIATAVIPVYNSKKYISRAIKSIQNQNLLNIEIILVDDKSKDDTLAFIKEIQKGDPRIKIIANKKNMGILYSRCIGVLSSKGKYIFPLDNDDMFLDEDVFQTITNIAEKGFFDIVEFKGIESKKGDKGILDNPIGDTKYANHPLNIVIYQPALGNYPVWPTRNLNYYHVESVYLWAKCIRTEMYIKAIKRLGKKRYGIHILRYEDIIMNYVLFNTAKSYKFVGKYGVLYIYRAESTSRRFTMVQSDIYHIHYLSVAIAFVQDRPENKKILVNFIIRLMGRSSLSQTLKNKDINKLFISCVDRVLKMTNISEDLKKEIRNKGKKLNFIKYPF